jgi:hypothetical protein
MTISQSTLRLVAVLLAACAPPMPGTDAQQDADAGDTSPVPDVSTDVSMDVSVDVLADVSMDAAGEGGLDAAADANDAAMDAAMDAGPACPSGQRLCGSACVDTQSNLMNCGACGTACAGGQTCAMGVCACPSGQQLCGAACVDTQSSAMNCGACGTACPMGQMCVTGACRIDCPAPRTVCGTGAMMVCADTATDPMRCGSCTNACAVANGTAGCATGACRVAGCNAGFGDCDGAAANGCEVDTSTSLAHCGACGRACAVANGTPSCAMGSCRVASCDAGFADCDGVTTSGCEADTRTSVLHCGGCGRACAVGQMCVAGMCTPPPAVLGGPTFQIRSLGATGCVTAEHDAVTGDDRGGIALGTARVFYSGDTATGAFDRQSLAGTPVAGASLDAMVSDVRTQTAYTFATAGGVLPNTGGVATRMIALDPTTGASTGAAIALSATITFAGNTMFGAGWGRVVVLTNGRAYNIATPSGAVTDLGAMSVPSVRQGCESWATWGTAEFFGGQLYLDYVANSTTIARMAVPGGTVTTLTTFMNLSDMCSFVVSPWDARWYWHHEGTSEFRAGSETIGYCDAQYTTDAQEITALTTANCTAIEHLAITGDDRGGIALTSANVLYTGDTSSGRFALPGLTGAAGLGRVYDVMVTDVGTQTAYAFTSGGVPAGSLSLDGVTRLDANGLPAGPVVALSRTITVGAGTGVFSGAGRAVIATGGRALEVDLATGGVADIGPFVPQDPSTCEGWGGFFGMAELIEGEVWLAYAAGPTPVRRIVRQRVGSTNTLLVAAFAGGGRETADLCSFTVAPALDRWFFHYEDNGFARNGDETLGVCDATMNGPANFRVTSLASAMCTTADTNAVSGDDRGGIAASFEQVFLSGDVATGRASVDAVTGYTSIGRIADGILSNLATGQVFTLADAAGVPLSAGAGLSFPSTAWTQLVELDPATGALTSRRVPLSAPITLAGSCCGAVGLYAGWNVLVIHGGTTVTSIDLPSGRVRVASAPRTQPTRVSSENWATWGVAERFGGQLYLTYHNANALTRMRVSDGATSVLQAFTNLGDMASFTVSPHLGRWFSHAEGGNELGTASESLTVCAASYSGAR